MKHPRTNSRRQTSLVAMVLAGATTICAGSPVIAEGDAASRTHSVMQVDDEHAVADTTDPAWWQWSGDAIALASSKASTPKSIGGYVDDRFFTGEFGDLPRPREDDGGADEGVTG